MSKNGYKILQQIWRKSNGDNASKKIIRDIGENRWAFLAIMCICSLGIALFSGINMYVSTIENEVTHYYDRANLADYWIYKAEISNSDLDNIRSLGEIKEAQRRKVTDITLSGAANSVLHIMLLMKQQ